MDELLQSSLMVRDSAGDSQLSVPLSVGDGQATAEFGDNGVVVDWDAKLVACSQGDKEAFAQLHDHFRGTTYGVIKKVLRDPAQSEEVTQEVMAEVWRLADRFDPERGSAQTWILTVAKRRAIDRVRSVQASRDRTARIGRREYVRPFDDVSESVLTRIECDQVRAALTQLTGLQRQAVELAFHGGYTYREVAELLGKPLGTVKTRVRDGLIRLRVVMGAPQ